MKAKFITLLTVAAIAFGGLTAAPAQAKSNVDGLILFLLGAAVIHSATQNKPKATVTKNTHAKQRPYYKRNGWRNRYQPKPPKKCMFKKHTRRGWKTFYSQRCFNRLGYEGPIPRYAEMKRRNPFRRGW